MWGMWEEVEVGSEGGREKPEPVPREIRTAGVEASSEIWAEFTAYTLKFQALDQGTTGLSLALGASGAGDHPKDGDTVLQVDSEFVKKEWIGEP